MNKPLTFITGNKNKFAQLQNIIPKIEQLDIDLPEIQSLDPREIIAAKLKAAEAYHEGNYIVEDTSVVFEGMKHLPGPLIKWFLEDLGTQGLAELAFKLETQKASAITWIGYSTPESEPQFFEGVIEGTVVMPRGDSGFGWDSTFLPHGSEKTFAELTFEEKKPLSSRVKAAEKLKESLGL